MVVWMAPWCTGQTGWTSLLTQGGFGCQIQLFRFKAAVACAAPKPVDGTDQGAEFLSLEGLGLLWRSLTATDGFESVEDLRRCCISEWILDVVGSVVLQSDFEFGSAGDLLERLEVLADHLPHIVDRLGDGDC
jgi:hypothetical protein